MRIDIHDKNSEQTRWSIRLQNYEVGLDLWLTWYPFYVLPLRRHAV